MRRIEKGFEMISKTVTIVNAQGFHMRPATLFAAEAGKFASKVTVGCKGKEVPGNSAMAIMTLFAKCGDVLEIRADGPDEAAAVDAIVAFVESGMGD